jgi:hypothetical protein
MSISFERTKTIASCDLELLESSRDAGYATKVVFISTEDPNLNVGRILIRLADMRVQSLTVRYTRGTRRISRR